MPTSVPRIVDGDASFWPGMESVSDPVQLPPGAYARGMNVVNRGGIIQTRPGYRCKLTYPEGLAQGLAVFRPAVGPEEILAAVAGKIYRSAFPFDSYTQLPGIQFSPIARQVYFQQVEQNVRQNPDGSLSLIPARRIMVMQDGALTAPATYDGTTSEHTSTIPLGGPMAFIGDRLWVARDIYLFPSDIFNPLAFTDFLFFATVEALVFSSAITALTTTPSTDNPALVVFTEDNTSFVQANIRDRAIWINVENFQKVVLPTIGCISPRSPVKIYGFLWWYSRWGLVNLDSSNAARISSKLPYRDNEMLHSKGRLAEDLSNLATGFYENYLLVSAPYVELRNRHTWCLDNSPQSNLNQIAPPVWNSFWTGTRPVEWVSGTFGGKSGIYYLSEDYDCENRLWEAFTPDRQDNKCPITCYVETRGYIASNPLVNKEFRYSKAYLGEISGVLDAAIFWAGSARGKFKRILTQRFIATRGCFRPGMRITMGTKLFALKKQSREAKTQDGREILEGENQSSCDVESPNAEFIDEAFQLLIVWSGPAAVRGIRVFMDPTRNPELSGSCPEDETEENLVRFDGASAEGDFEDAYAVLESDVNVFTSRRVETITVDGFTAIGTGIGESIISQQDADKQATSMGRRIAARTLERTMLPIVSQGEIFGNDVFGCECCFTEAEIVAAAAAAAIAAVIPVTTGPAFVNLGMGAGFAILAGTTVTNTGPTAVNGDLGLSPGTSVTGFPPGTVSGTQHITDSAAAQAQLDLTVAYNDAAGRTSGVITVAGNIGGQTLLSGLYKSNSTLAISSGELTLDAQGNSNAVFIFQVASALTVTSGRQVILTGGARAANVFWQIGSSATLGTTSSFKGSILALTSITAMTGAIIEGRLLARNGAVTLDTNVVTIPT